MEKVEAGLHNDSVKQSKLELSIVPTRLRYAWELEAETGVWSYPCGLSETLD